MSDRLFKIHIVTDLKIFDLELAFIETSYVFKSILNQCLKSCCTTRPFGNHILFENTPGCLQIPNQYTKVCIYPQCSARTGLDIFHFS